MRTFRIRLSAAIAVAALTLAPTDADAQTASQVILYADGGANDTPRERVVTTSVGGATSLSTLSATAARLVARAHPTNDEIAMLTEDDTGRLTLRIRSTGTWGADQVLTTDVSGGSGRGFDAAYEHSSGELLIVYRKAGSSLLFHRIWDGSLSSESTLDLSLGATPDRLVLHPNSRTDAVLVTTSAGTSLSAAIWSGSAFGDTVALDTGFDGGARNWDAAHEPGSGEPTIVWARSGDTWSRVRRFASSTWQTQSTGPFLGSAIERIRLAADPSSTRDGLLAGFGVTATNETLYVSFWDGSTWSTATSIATDLDGTGNYPFGVSYEGAGGGAIAAWAGRGDTVVRTRRWDGSSWGPTTSTGTVGADIVDLVVAPRDGEADVIIAARRSTRYVAHTEAGSLGLAGVTVTGAVSVNGAGVDLPASPGGTSGAPDLGYGNGDDQTISPGSYGTLSVGNGTTLRFTAGTYVFESFDSNKNGTELIFDTSGGDVTFVVDSGDVDLGNSASIQRTGSGTVRFHVLDGDFDADNSATFDAMIVTHDGTISLRNDATITGHLFASSNIDVTSGTLSLPTWKIAGSSETSGESVGALVVDDGTPGSVATITASDWIELTDHPVAISHQVGAAGWRIVRWREIER